MSQLKIYTNSAFEIKALYFTDDKTLTEFVVDREAVFGNHTDAYIKGFKYQPIYDEAGEQTSVVVTPYMAYDVLESAEAGTLQAIDAVNPTIYVNHSTLDELKAFHKTALGRVGSKVIYDGIDYNGKHYSLTDQDQQNISVLVMNINANKIAHMVDPDGTPLLTHVAYHADGDTCTLTSVEDMLIIGNMAQAYVTYHTTRINQLNQMIKETTTKKKCLAIEYTTDLDVVRLEAFNEIMEGLGITGELRMYFDTTILKAGKVEGEIYTNSGSMIDPMTYDTEAFLDLDNTVITTGNNSSSIITIPTFIADPDKVDGSYDKFMLSVIFNVLTNDDNMIKETYVTNYEMEYKADAELANPRVITEVPGPAVLSCSIPVGLVYNELTDKVNADEKFYIIKTNAECKVTTDFEEVNTALGIAYEEPGENVEDPIVENDPAVEDVPDTTV